MNKKNLKDYFTKHGKDLVVPGIMFLLGLFCIIDPTNIKNTVMTLVGFLCILAGVFLGSSLLSLFSPLTFSLALILVIFGIVSLANPGGMSSMIIFIIGAAIIVNALCRIYDAYQIRGKSDDFKFYIINDVITLVLGIVLLVAGNWTADWVIRILGIFMAVLGISNIVTSFRVYKDGHFVDDGTDTVWEE